MLTSLGAARESPVRSEEARTPGPFGPAGPHAPKQILQRSGQWHRRLRPTLLSLAIRSRRRDRSVRRRGAGALCCGRGTEAFAGSGFTISMLPLKYAPSSMTMRAVRISPISFASLLISIRSVGFDVALNGSQRDHFARLHRRMHGSVRANGQLVVGRFDGALDIPVHIQIFFAVDLAVDLDGLSDRGRITAITRSFRSAYWTSSSPPFWAQRNWGPRGECSARWIEGPRRLFVPALLIPHIAALLDEI